jgi:hypothetical protein
MLGSKICAEGRSLQVKSKFLFNHTTYSLFYRPFVTDNCCQAQTGVQPAEGLYNNKNIDIIKM